MIYRYFRQLSVSGLLLLVSAFAQEIPLQEPHLLPFPALEVGVSIYSLIPTQNLLLSSNVGGWTAKDIMPATLINLNLELLRYRWWDHFFNASPIDAYSSLHYSISSQLSTIALPNSYPSSFEFNKTILSGFSLNARVTEFSLGHNFSYSYSQKGSVHANLRTGLTQLGLYKNTEGVRLLTSNGLGFHFGIGWKYSFLGRTGKQLRAGVNLGYSIRNFDLTDQDENLKLADGSDGLISPIESISINTPELTVSLEFGEALFAANTPYRDPYRLGLFQIAVGSGFVNYVPGITLQFDSTNTSINIPSFAKVSRSYDLQIFKYNWPFHLIRQANIDVFSGLGLRTWKTSQSVKLPTNWARDFTDGSTVFSGMSLAPRVFDIYLKHEIIYPLGTKLHAKVNGGNGFSTMTLYENGVDQRLIDASSLTWQAGAGLGYTIRGDGSSKVAFGFNVNYYHQAFDIDLNNSNLSVVNTDELAPISHIDLSQLVFSLEIGLIFGGNPNQGQKAHQLFKKKHFAEALEQQDELLDLYPNHHNKQAILLQKQMIKDSLVAHYYHDVETILESGKLENAFSLIQLGDVPPEAELIHAVQEMKITISDQALTRAADALEKLNYSEAEKLILLALKSDPSSMPVAKALLARSYIIRATILYHSGVFRRSLYWLKQADGLTDRYQIVTQELRQKIGDGRLDDANEAILKEDRQMVYTSMQDAKTLNPVLAEVVDEYISDLEAAILHVEEEQMGPLKRMVLDNLLDDVQGLDPDNFTPQVGMQGSLIARYVGPPARKFEEGDYELWVYHRPEDVELWLYLQNGIIEKIEYQQK